MQNTPADRPEPEAAAAPEASSRPPPSGVQPLPLQPGDFYWEHGRLVLTAAYHRRRGYCCGSGCRHCPYPRP